MKIIIKKYDPNWETEFQKEKQLLLKSINDSEIVVEHIGSTSIKGLGAKPVIDIMIGVTDFSMLNNYVPAIEGLGYTYISKYEDMMPYRRFFIKERNDNKTHHIHMVEIDSEFWIRHIAFRDHLRSNKTDRDNYYTLKKNLSKQEWKDGNEYAAAKTEFIKSIESRII